MNKLMVFLSLSLSEMLALQHVFSIWQGVTKFRMNPVDPPSIFGLRAYAAWSNLAFSSGVSLGTEFLSFLHFHVIR
jgi:hypothetical protein